MNKVPFSKTEAIISWIKKLYKTESDHWYEVDVSINSPDMLTK